MVINPSKVKRLYAFWGARWYDLFKPVMNVVLAQTENELRMFLLGNLEEGKTILELGCGTGENLQTIRAKLQLPFKHYLGLDFSPDMLRIARKKFENEPCVTFHQCDITTDLDNMAAEGKCFDTIICTWVLSHIPDPVSLVNQAQKLLKKDGKMFLSFFSKPVWYFSFWDWVCERFWSMSTVSGDTIQEFDNVKQIRRHPFGPASMEI